MYRVVVYPQAKKGLRKFTPEEQRRVVKKLRSVAGDPFGSHINATKMKEYAGGFRLRVGKLRVIYTLDTKAKIMIVWKISPRGSAYRP